MNSYRCLLSLLVTALIFTTKLLSSEIRGVELDENRDFESVLTYITSKRTIPYAEKSDYLKIFGDIRWEWDHQSERQDGRQLRGGGAVNSKGIPLSRDTYDVIFNLKFDYDAKRTWGFASFQFDNSAGTEESFFGCNDPMGMQGSGFCDDICMKRAYWGWTIYEGDSDKVFLDVEVGRRPLYTIFDSRIQFQARFDGILLWYSDNFKGFSDFYIKGGPFVVDQRVNHYAYVVEAGFLNFMDWRFDMEYSYIDWTKRGTNRCGTRRPAGWEYRNSQWSLAYNFKPEVIGRKARLYGAFLVNHAARKRPLTNNQYQNIGWYAGGIIGEVRKKGDWSLDINYQFVEAQAIADCDVHGIGRGNVLKETFNANARGKANYKGWSFEALYAITDMLSVDALYQFSNAEDNQIGGHHFFSKLEVDIILTF